MKLGDALRLGAARLEGCLESPRLEAEFLLCALLGRTRSQLLAHPEQELDSSQETGYLEWLELRRRDYPLQYLRGFEEFWGRRFRVSPEVLIPRPETEILVEVALSWLGARQGPLRVSDLGTGSGCIAVTLCCEVPRLQMLAVDLHLPALQVARLNCRSWDCADRVRLVCGDLLEAFQPGSWFDLIVSNPPYVRRVDPVGLQVGVRDFEPELALFGGDDGLDFYRRLFRQAAAFLKPGGGLAVEMGFDQEPALMELALQSGWKTEFLRSDLSGHPRCALFSPLQDRERARTAAMS